MTENTDLTVIPDAPKKDTVMGIGQRGIALTTFDELWRFSNMIVRAKLAPKQFETPEAIMVAVQLGMEVGLSPMSALQNICVINGIPSIYGDGAMALVRASPQCEYVKEWIEGEGQNMIAYCVSKRKGDPEEHKTSFSVEDAKVAKLWGKNAVWQQNPKRMLMFRARGFNLRDSFADVLKGLKTAEEVEDYPAAAYPQKPNATAALLKETTYVETPEVIVQEEVKDEINEALTPNYTYEAKQDIVLGVGTIKRGTRADVVDGNFLFKTGDALTDITPFTLDELQDLMPDLKQVKLK